MVPLSSVDEGLRNVLSFLPGTYGTSLARNHCMRGALSEIENQGLSSDFVEALKDSLDCNMYFFSEKVSIPVMYLILGGSVAVLVLVYVLMNKFKKER